MAALSDAAQGCLRNGLAPRGEKAIKARIHCVTVAEDYHHDFGAVKHVDSTVGWNSKRPDISMTVELMHIEVRTCTTWFSP
jgi:hypothetical protein